MAAARQAAGETDRRILVGALFALGAVTGAVGALYAVNFLSPLPFRV